MRKLLLPTLVLLTTQSAMGSRHATPVRHLAQDDDGQASLVPLPESVDVNDPAAADGTSAESKPPTYNDPVEDHFDENYSFKFKKVTSYTKDEITSFWINKTNGEYCTQLFVEIYDKFNSLDETVKEIEASIDEYNQKCKDKCIPGYVVCEGDKSDKCIKEEDCCELHNKYTCEGTKNHPFDYHNWATGQGQTLYCYDWCCDETQVRCEDKCIPDGSLPFGYGHDDHHTYYDDHHNPIQSDYPKLCCKGQDCCDDKDDTYVPHLTQGGQEPFCCKIDEILKDGYNKDKCCCAADDAVCCPNLKTHCQSKDNYLCCDLTTQKYCNGKCVPKDLPCCQDGEFNCQY